MAKKVTYSVDAQARKNTEKGGAWLATFTLRNEDEQEVVFETTTAWTNANACKRWLKSVVVERTTRKSIKMSVTATDANDKATVVVGTLVFKS
jgi:hypothetical protein